MRFFHIREISPSGWIALPIKKTLEITGTNKKTTCAYEYSINYKNVIPLNDKEDIEPEEELVKDLMSIMNVYVAKMNGLRKYKQMLIDDIKSVKSIKSKK